MIQASTGGEKSTGVSEQKDKPEDSQRREGPGPGPFASRRRRPDSGKPPPNLPPRRTPRYPPTPTSSAPAGRPDPPKNSNVQSRPTFVVHGHDRAALHEAVRVLERGTGREVIVLHEQANAGRTILEKFEDHVADVSFAVVLLTGDDEGGIRGGTNKQPRGRQNVIFELGFLFGKLGRRRVAVLLEENVEKPSDIDGLVYITFDEAGAWKQSLARELEAAGISADRSRIP